MQKANLIRFTYFRILYVAFCLLACSTTSVAQPSLVGCTAGVSGIGPQPTSRLVDVDLITGAVSNSRDIGIKVLCGIATQPTTGTIFALTSSFSSPANSLVTINPITGAPSIVGATGLTQIVEGDLAFNPLNGLIYGLQDAGPLGNQRNLFQINPTTGVATIVGNIGNAGDYSALAFDGLGTLYAVDSSGMQNSLLLTISASTAQITSSVTMNVNLGATVGLSIDATTGTAYLGDDIASPASGGTNSIYTLDLTTGLATLVGPTGDLVGIAGLAFTNVPEPTSFTLGSAVTMAIYLLHRLRRRGNNVTDHKASVDTQIY